MRVDSREIYDLSGTLLGHLPADRLRSEKISFRSAVDALIKSFFGKIQEIAFMRDPRTVEQYVDATELGNGAPQGFFDFRFFCHVELKRERAPAERADLGR